VFCIDFSAIEVFRQSAKLTSPSFHVFFDALHRQNGADEREFINAVDRLDWPHQLSFFHDG
jgi:hypothetical protein